MLLKMEMKSISKNLGFKNASLIVNRTAEKKFLGSFYTFAGNPKPKFVELTGSFTVILPFKESMVPATYAAELLMDFEHKFIILCLV